MQLHYLPVVVVVSDVSDSKQTNGKTSPLHKASTFVVGLVKEVTVISNERRTLIICNETDSA